MNVTISSFLKMAAKPRLATSPSLTQEQLRVVRALRQTHTSTTCGSSRRFLSRRFSMPTRAPEQLLSLEPSVSLTTRSLTSTRRGQSSSRAMVILLRTILTTTTTSHPTMGQMSIRYSKAFGITILVVRRMVTSGFVYLFIIRRFLFPQLFSLLR